MDLEVLKHDLCKKLGLYPLAISTMYWLPLVSLTMRSAIDFLAILLSSELSGSRIADIFMGLCWPMESIFDIKSSKIS